MRNLSDSNPAFGRFWLCVATAIHLGLGSAALSSVVGCNGAKADTAVHVQDQARAVMKFEAGNPKLKYVNVETVRESSGSPALVLTGRVAFDEDHTQRVASPIDGRAISILAKPGDRVKPGQPLLELSSPHVGELQADAQKAAQELALREKAVERARKLKDDGAISEKDAVQVDADYRKAKADALRATAQLKSLALSPTEPAVTAAIRSQIAGTVVERNALVGQEIRADGATPLFTVSNLETVWVLADVYEQDLSSVHAGDPISLHVMAYPGEAFTGEVAHIGETVDPATRTVKLRCVLPNPEGRLKPEMFARVELRGAVGQSLILVPSRAILTDTEHAKVVVADEDNVFRTRVVDVGPEVDGKVRVLKGLSAGDRLVTDGAIFLAKEISG